jgi:hypothetical protein
VTISDDEEMEDLSNMENRCNNHIGGNKYGQMLSSDLQ